MAHSKWYQRFPQRIKAEQIIVSQRFPQFVLKEQKGILYWEGILITNFSTAYQVQIIYPDAYPYERPKFKVVKPEIRRDSPHRFIDGSLCVYPKKWEHRRCTAPAGVPLVAAWLALYEVWLRTGQRW